jgi:hypothetical protein
MSDLFLFIIIVVVVVVVIITIIIPLLLLLHFCYLCAIFYVSDHTVVILTGYTAFFIA